MEEPVQTTRERAAAAEILRKHREEVLRRWMERISLLAREKGATEVGEAPALRERAGEFIELLAGWLEGKGGEAGVANLYELIREGRQYDVRLADIAYVLLELKGVGRQIVFENVPLELEAFRISRTLAETIEGVLRKSADLYEVGGAADSAAARDRLQEIFSAWDLESAVAYAQTPAAVCRIATEKLGQVWDLLTCHWRLYEHLQGSTRDIIEGPDVPIPRVRERRQYLTGQEQEAGGRISLLDQVRRRREAYICPDVTADPQVVNSEELRKAGARSLACQPLIARDKVVGALLIYGTKPGALKASDEAKLSGLAGVCALALDRTGRLELTHRRLSESEVIARIGRSLLELPSREALLQGVAEALRSFRDYFDVSLFLVNRETEECELVAEAGRERTYRPEDYRQKLGEGFIGICAETGETIRATDLEEDSRRLVAFDEEYRVRTELAVPVRGAGETIGVIHILSDREEDFPQSELAAVQHVAPHIGVALQNVRMIDQRVRDRYEIERAHRQLANIIRSTAVGITSVDTRGVYTHWSPSCEDMLGYSAEEVVGKATPADFAEESYDVQAMLEECLREGFVTHERAWRRNDGTLRTIKETRVPLYDERDRHIGFTSYLVDVTEQKQAEQQLRRERDMLQLVVDAMGAGLALFDADGRLQWVNATVRDWFELGADWKGKKCHEVYLCGREAEDICPAMEAAMSGRPQSHNYEFTDSEGRWHCYQQIFTPLRYGETRLILLNLDITEQRRRNEQMRLIGKLTEQVETSLDLDRVLHVVLTCVTAGHAIGFNRAFIFLLDADGDYLEGRMAVGPLSAEDARRIWGGMAGEDQTIDQLGDSTEPSESDRELTERLASLRVPTDRTDSPLISTLNSRTAAHVGDARSDPHLGKELAETLGLEEFVCAPLAVRDESLGVMLVDNKFSGSGIYRYQVELLEMFSRQASLAISNALAYEQIRTQLAELRRTRDKLIEAERMASVGRMAGHLAHEIRNPLTTIGGFAASIARRHEEGSKTHENATIIYEEARRLERTLVNVLDYTRPLRPNKKLISLNELVRSTAEQYREQFEENNITTRWSLQEDLQPIKADPEMIKQVIVNLFKNGIEAMEGKEEGVLSVETGMEDGTAVLRIADTGGGMPEEVAENLFSPFFTTKIAGVGLGLSVSRRIVRQHGGDIRAESELGTGSRFTVSLETGNPENEGGSDG